MKKFTFALLITVMAGSMAFAQIQEEKAPAKEDIQKAEEIEAIAGPHMTLRRWS